LNAKKGFQADHKEVKEEFARYSAPQLKGSPTTVFGYIAESLKKRKELQLPPFTVLSCDNVQGNGDAAKQATLAFASALDKTGDLSSWIQRSVTFPNSMVDRIAPKTTPDDVKQVQSKFNVLDNWPVVTEPFRQWVIEDHFVSRPRLETVGVQMTKDVLPYELLKLRLLNASHSGVSYLAYLSGVRLVHDACGDPLFDGFLTRLMDKEVTPFLPKHVEGVDIEKYKISLRERFQNPQIRDQITRLCMDGSAKFPVFLLPSLKEHKAAGKPAPPLLSLIVASWIRFLNGKDEQNQSITVEDPMAQQLAAAPKAPRKFIAHFPEIFGAELSSWEGFLYEVERYHGLLLRKGARKTLEEVMATKSAL